MAKVNTFSINDFQERAIYLCSNVTKIKDTVFLPPEKFDNL